MMPKGVEHPYRTGQGEIVGEVSPTLMPKGVEHCDPGEAMAIFEDCVADVDAERR